MPVEVLSEDELQQMEVQAIRGWEYLCLVRRSDFKRMTAELRTLRAAVKRAQEERDEAKDRAAKGLEQRGQILHRLTEVRRQFAALLAAAEEALRRIDTQGGPGIRSTMEPLREAVAAARKWEGDDGTGR